MIQMEKVCFVYKESSYSIHGDSELNNLLSNGWKVKQITSDSYKDSVVFVFVLEK